MAFETLFSGYYLYQKEAFLIHQKQSNIVPIMGFVFSAVGERDIKGITFKRR